MNQGWLYTLHLLSAVFQLTTEHAIKTQKASQYSRDGRAGLAEDHSY
jgi:hypothetical protein